MQSLAIHHIKCLSQQLLASIYAKSQAESVVDICLDLLQEIHAREPSKLPHESCPEIGIVEDEGIFRKEQSSMMNLLSTATNGYELSAVKDDLFIVTIHLVSKTGVHWRADHLRKLLNFMIFVTRSLHFENAFLDDMQAHIANSLMNDPSSHNWMRKTPSTDQKAWSSIAKHYSNSSDQKIVNKYLDIYSPESTGTLASDQVDGRRCRFKLMRELLDLTLLSSSPLIRYPAPYILKRLEREEALNMSSRSSTPTEFDNTSTPDESLTTRMQRLSVHNSLNNARYTPSSSDRASLESMVKNNDSIDGRIRHQSLTVLATIAVDMNLATHDEDDAQQLLLPPPCQAETHNFSFWKFGDTCADSSDISFGDFIRQMAAQTTTVCRSSHQRLEGYHCEVLMSQHIFSYAHNSGKIHVRNYPMSDIMLYPKRDLSGDDIQILAWTTCHKCCKSTSVNALTAVSEQYSFSKFLELIIYNPLFFPHSMAICNCEDLKTVDPAHRRELVRYFLHAGRVIMFQYEEIEMLEISLSALDAKEGEVQQSRDSIAAADGYGLVLADSQQLDVFTNYVTAYWAVIYKFLEAMSDIVVDFAVTGQSMVLPKYVKLFWDRLKAEELVMKELISMANHEITRMEKLIRTSQIDDSHSVISASDVFSSPTLIIRDIRHAIMDKALAVDREIAHWSDTILHDFPFMSEMMPKYSVCPHPDSTRRKLASSIDFSNADAPSMISFALASSEVRDILGILEEVTVLLKTHDTDGLSECATAEKWLTQFKSQYQNVIKLGQYPTKFEATNDDGSVTSAYLEDTLHIHFTYSRSVVLKNEPESFEEISRLKRSSSNASSDILETSSQFTQKQAVTEFSVTVHYGYLYHLLRARTRLPAEDFAKSVSKCRGWTPSGGKSGSKFFVTDDEKFVIKSLGRQVKARTPSVSQRSLSRSPSRNNHRREESDSREEATPVLLLPNEEERRQMLTFAPRYLMHMLCKILSPSSSSASCPSLLVKMLGMFTVKSRQFESIVDTKVTAPKSTAKWTEMDYIIMEHLFRGRSIAKKFDLKGIKTRVVDPKNSKAGRIIPLFRLFANNEKSSVTDSSDDVSRCRTLWDGNWLENVYRQSAKSDSAEPSDALLATLFESSQQKQNSSILCVHPHSKHLLSDTMRRDTDFLAKNNVIDYSLLVGVDEERQELVMGIVDFIGEYTFWKKMENKGKTTLMYLEKRFKDVVKMSSLEENTQNNSQDHRASNNSESSRSLSSQSRDESPHRSSWSSASSQVTVQPPDAYKSRFTAAMGEYFLSVPDKWHI